MRLGRAFEAGGQMRRKLDNKRLRARAKTRIRREISRAFGGSPETRFAALRAVPVKKRLSKRRPTGMSFALNNKQMPNSGENRSFRTMKHSRRQFLRLLGLAGLFLTARGGFAQPSSLTAADSSAFEMLVIGDSLIWGQGLKEEDKSYRLVKQWFEKEVFAGKRPVNIKVKAHSGSALVLREDEIADLKKIQKPETERLFPEIPVSFPSIRAQIDAARAEYENPRSVNLILLSGSIADLVVADVINIFNDEKALRRKIPKYCYEAMFRLLEHAALTFPNALISVAGYYPIVSKKSSTRKIFDAVFELYKFPRFAKPILNNVATRRFLWILHKKAARRSRIWLAESNIELQKAVNRLNAEAGKTRAVFVPTPFAEEHSYAAKNTLLWELKKKARLEDAFFEERLVQCKKELAALKNTALRYSVRFCELAAIGHPNAEGAKVFARAIQNALKPFLRFTADF